MLEIHVFTLLDHTVATVWYKPDRLDGSGYVPHKPESLAYVCQGLLPGDNTDDLAQVIGDALYQGEQRSADLGGWSLLV